jgi:alpha-mannosidase
MTASGGWRENLLGLTAEKVLSNAWIEPGAPDVEVMADSIIHIEGEKVMIGCAKKASRGQGLIIRLISFNSGPEEISLKVKNNAINRAFICDARERDLEEAEVENGEGRIRINGPITTVRLHF